METPNTIKHLIQSGESKRLEFKTGNVTLNTLGQTICGFLNSGGGQILVGVNDDGIIDGYDHLEKIEDLLRPLSGGDHADSRLVPNAIWDATLESIDDTPVVMIDVPAGVDIPYVFDDSIYIRLGSTTRKATGKQTRDLIERRYLQGARWERLPALGVSLNDLDTDQILKTASIASSQRGWRFQDNNDPFAILEALNLVDYGKVTNAAVVLFAKEAGHILPQSHVRMTAYSSNKASSEYIEDKVSRGHLFSHLEAYDSFIQRNVRVRSEFSSLKSQREDLPSYPYWSLREGFRNALIHRDFESIHGRVSVSLYKNRFELWNSGNFPAGITVNNIKTADRSQPVNPDIAQVVFLRGLVELLGRGTRKIVEDFQSQGMPNPIWKKQAGGINLTLRSRVSSHEQSKELNSRQLDLIHSMKPGDQVDIAAYSDKTGSSLSERTLRNDLSSLTKSGFLAKQGQGKNTFYVRTEKPS